MQPTEFGIINQQINIPKQEEKEPKQEGASNIYQETPNVNIDYSDEQLEDLSKKWKNLYESYSSTLEYRIKNNKTYLRGDQLSQFSQWKQSIPLDEYPPLYNLIYECMEILAPMATKSIPQVTVNLDNENTPDSKILAKHIQEICDSGNLKFELENALRDRYTDFIGVLKIYYDVFEDKIKIEKINPSDILVDPRGNMVNGIMKGEFVGQLVTIPQTEAKRRFSNKLDILDEYFGGDVFKKFTYIEWWTDTLVFQTCKGKLLDKFKNPYWNYEKDVEVVDELGNVSIEMQPGINHLKKPPIPFVFINIQNDGTRPHDTTTELEQSIPLQHAFDQMMYQINKNAQRCNGYVVTKGVDAGKAADIAQAGWNGGIITLSQNAEFEIKTGSALPSFIFEHKSSLEIGIRNIFGVRGSSPQGVQGDQTVRGKMIMGQQDGNRVNTITNRLELACTNIFNIIAQLLYVTEKIPTIGYEIKAKPGSMIPKDSVTQRNEAMDLWSMKAIDPINLFEKLDFPNPLEASQRLVDFQLMPQMFASPELQQMMAAAPAPAPDDGGGENNPPQK
jgi:hypothetical protein